MTQLLLLVSILVSACAPGAEQGSASSGTSLPLHHIKMPDGFRIDVYAEGVRNARSMTLSPGGTLFVGSRQAGNVYALRDTDGDFKVDEQYTLISGMNQPNGVAFRDGDLYFAEIDKVWVWRDIESKLANPGRPELVTDGYPDKAHHGWKYIAFGPDGYLYVPVGAPCNICESEDDVFASITKLDVSTGLHEIVCHGVRNTVGFDWHPETSELWFTDNGGDWLGDDMPACELNYAPREGMHFGFPWCHQGDFPDPKLAGNRRCSEFVPPAQKLGPHVAPLGMEFYDGSMFPAAYKNQVLIAEHGSWNRSTPIGYRVMMVRVEGNNRALSYESFAEGWLQGSQAWGRPVDLEHLPDGSMLVSDDYANAIYRISYEK